MANDRWRRAVLGDLTHGGGGGSGGTSTPASRGAQGPRTGAPGRGEAQPHVAEPAPRHLSEPTPDDGQEDARRGERVDPAAGVGAVAVRARSGDPAARRAWRQVAALTRSSGHTRAYLEAVEELRRPVSTGRRVAVTGIRGGSGATTVAALLGTVLAARRHDPVLAVDADPEEGSLAWRLGVAGEGAPAGEELAPYLLGAQVRDLDDVDAILPVTPGGLRVLPPFRRGGPAATGTGVVVGALARYFGVTVLDVPYGAPATDPPLPPAHATVLTAAATVDGVRRMLAALDRTRSDADELATTVAVLVSRNPATEGLDVRRALRMVRAQGVLAHHLPYDRHLAAGSGVSPRQIAQSSLVVATRLAGAALGCAGATRGGSA